NPDRDISFCAFCAFCGYSFVKYSVRTRGTFDEISTSPLYCGLGGTSRLRFCAGAEEVDATADAGRTAGYSGNLELRNNHAVATACRSCGKRILHGEGSRCLREADARAER